MRAGAHVTDRRAGLGLADTDAEQSVTAGRDRQPAVTQLVGAEVLDRPRRAVEDELGQDRARHVGAGELLEHDRGFDVAQARAAPLLADGDPEQLGLTDRVPRCLRELLRLVALARHRCERPVGDVASELAERGLVFGVREGIDAARCADAGAGADM